MLKVYTSKIVTTQKIYRKPIRVKRIKKSIPVVYNVIDIAAIILFFPLLLIHLYSFYNEVMSFDYFKIKNIAFSGLKLIDKKEGLSYVSSIKGCNIFKADTQNLKGNLLKSDIIKTVQIEKKLPDSLKIDVIEKKPYIQFRIGDCFHVYDENFSRIMISDIPLRDLYIVNAMIKRSFFKKAFLTNESKQDFKEFLFFLKKYETILPSITVEALDPENLNLSSSEKSLKILIGNGDYCEKFDKFIKYMMSHEQALNLSMVEIDNRFEGMIIVRKS
jgi:cell division protein FtsQ